MVRRSIFSFAGLILVVALCGGTASAAALPGCGPLRYHEFRCSAPVLTVKADPGCQAPNGRYLLPPIHIRANGGLRKVVIKLKGRTVRTLHYHHAGAVPSERGPRFKTIKGVKIRKLKHGRYRVYVQATDYLGKKSHTTFPIAVCKPPPPPFTG
jgi:hypothetical protein